MLNGTANFIISAGVNHSLLENNIPAYGEAAGVKNAMYKHTIEAQAIAAAVTGSIAVSAANVPNRGNIIIAHTKLFATFVKMKPANIIKQPVIHILCPPKIGVNTPIIIGLIPVPSAVNEPQDQLSTLLLSVGVGHGLADGEPSQVREYTEDMTEYVNFHFIL